ncbi:MAG: T9SS type A sorting domain-containing protein [Bacteroidetes bacterium]|nr:T9SS type A sorting domain-containing protein [Bacteroidota bacterium]
MQLNRLKFSMQLALIFVLSISDVFAQSLPPIPILKPWEFGQAPASSTNKTIDVDEKQQQLSSYFKKSATLLNNIAFFDANELRTAVNDTVYVGDVPDDTLVITGTYFNNGPVLVFNDGVLIMESATATILGDIYVFQDGKLSVNNSTLNMPQQYFYQRGIIVANQGDVFINNSTLDFSGLSHSLTVVHDGSFVMNNVNNIGFTTAGGYNHAQIAIDSTNLAGEFIMQDNASFQFSNCNTLLLWHQFPASAVINYSFPANGTVANYQFNNLVPGVSGINYNVTVSNCTDVMWSLMPVNGSDVTISNSTLRVIGAWFTNGDTAAVSGLVNNSNYASFTAPLNDRVLQLNNCSVQTWSLYVFDSSYIDVTGCIIGELGTLNRSRADAQNILCDGSGGYYWSSDTTLGIVFNSTILGSLRSERNSILLFAYGSVSGSTSAVGNSLLVVTQTTVPQDPIPYNGGTVWFSYLNQPSGLFVDTIVTLNGSAWIDSGPDGAPYDFDSYILSYSAVSNPNSWIPMGISSANEVHNGFLGDWNTNGLVPGGYNLRVQTISNFGDTIEAIRQVTLLPSIVGLNEDIFQDWILSQVNGQPYFISGSDFKGDCLMEIYDVNGSVLASEKVLVNDSRQQLRFDYNLNTSGVYLINIKNGKHSKTFKWVKE